ncbi:conserved hypothetical protein [Ricinus communis]|uniref:Reverse transcriptase zinc-binding domain-containing protein n=1 Tax=Ricinus communis TaxID=3988 RepID=B9T0C7_RICCO|nr:conserved hypothetical protein [Ricinus communis]
MRISTSILPVGSIMKSRLRKNDACLRCDTPETLKHLFFGCCLSQAVWRISPLGLKNSHLSGLDFLSICSKMVWSESQSVRKAIEDQNEVITACASPLLRIELLLLPLKSARSGPLSSPFILESLALREAVRWASIQGCIKVVFEGIQVAKGACPPQPKQLLSLKMLPDLLPPLLNLLRLLDQLLTLVDLHNIPLSCAKEKALQFCI